MISLRLAPYCPACSMPALDDLPPLTLGNRDVVPRACHSCGLLLLFDLAMIEQIERENIAAQLGHLATRLNPTSVIAKPIVDSLRSLQQDVQQTPERPSSTAASPPGPAEGVQ